MRVVIQLYCRSLSVEIIKTTASGSEVAGIEGGPPMPKKLARISAGTRANSTTGPGQISTLKNCSSEKTERKMEKGLGIGHDCEKWSTYLLTSMKLDHSDEATESDWESRGGIMG